jgi:hypothetical protein
MGRVKELLEDYMTNEEEQEPLQLSGNMKEIQLDNKGQAVVNVAEILKERGKRYGDFYNHAEITQALKSTFYTLSPQTKHLTPAMSEAIDMIFHKLGRIGNGDPFYLDSWVDIAGYAQLVVDILEGQEDEPF